MPPLFPVIREIRRCCQHILSFACHWRALWLETFYACTVQVCQQLCHLQHTVAVVIATVFVLFWRVSERQVKHGYTCAMCDQRLKIFEGPHRVERCGRSDTHLLQIQNNGCLCDHVCLQLRPAALPEGKRWAHVWVIWYYFNLLFNRLKNFSTHWSTLQYPLSPDD